MWLLFSESKILLIFMPFHHNKRYQFCSIRPTVFNTLLSVWYFKQILNYSYENFLLTTEERSFSSKRLKVKWQVKYCQNSIQIFQVHVYCLSFSNEICLPLGWPPSFWRSTGERSRSLGHIRYGSDNISNIVWPLTLKWHDGFFLRS